MILLAILLVAVASEESGFRYDVPSVPFKLPNSRPVNLQSGKFTQSLGAIAAQGVTEKSVSKVISHNDYPYIQSQKANGKDSLYSAKQQYESIGTDHIKNIHVQTGQSFINRNHVPKSFTLSGEVNRNNQYNLNLPPGISNIGIEVNNCLANIASQIDRNSLNGHTGSLNSATANVNGYVQTQSLLPSIPTALSINNILGLDAGVGSGHENISPATSNNNVGIGQTLTPPSNNFNLNSGYTETLSPQVGVNLNSNGIVRTLRPPIETNLNSGFSTLMPLNQNLKIFNEQVLTSSDSSAAAGLSNDQHINLSNGITAVGDISLSSGVNSTNSAIAPPAPIVTKNIYFHVSQPNLEKPRQAAPPPPPNKDYKILFIKVPSQENANSIRVQQLAQSQKALVEEKTVIYVLVKKPDTQVPVAAPQRTKSNHEVFFVKYNGDPLDIASHIKDELDQTDSVGSAVPVLEPRTILGHK